MRMNLLIRPVRLNDAEDINEMRRQIEVRTHTLAIATETILITETFLRNMGTDDHILDLADNWLMLVRIELDVTEENERAISLYNSFGFEVEGKKKYFIIKGGKYADVLMMARYFLPSQFK